MKIFILFALAGVSLSNDYGGGFPRPPVGCGPFGQGGGSMGQNGGSWDEHGGSGGQGWGSTGHGGSSGSTGHGGSSGSTGHGGSSGSTGHGGSSGSSWDFECNSDSQPDFNKDDNCFGHALEVMPELMIAGQQLLCHHLNNQEDMHDEKYEELTRQLDKFARCAGCGVGDIVGLEQPLGELGSTVGQTGGKVLHLLGNLKKALRLENVVLDLACKLLGPFLASKCAHDLLSEKVSAVVDNLDSVLCSKDEDLNVTLVIGTMKDAGCMGDDLLGTEDTVEKLTEELGEAVAPLAKGLVHTVKKIPLIGDVLQKVGCTVTNLLNGVVNGKSNLIKNLLGGLTGGSGGGLGDIIKPVTDTVGGVLGGGNSGGLGGGILKPVIDTVGSILGGGNSGSTGGGGRGLLGGLGR